MSGTLCVIHRSYSLCLIHSTMQLVMLCTYNSTCLTVPTRSKTFHVRTLGCISLYLTRYKMPVRTTMTRSTHCSQDILTVTQMHAAQ